MSSLYLKGPLHKARFVMPDNPYSNSYMNSFSKYGNVSSLADLQSMPSTELQTINALVIGNTPVFWTFTFGKLLSSKHLTFVFHYTNFLEVSPLTAIMSLTS